MPITIVGEYHDNSIGGWRTFVMHHNDGYHYERYNIHNSRVAERGLVQIFWKINWKRSVNYASARVNMS